MLVKLEPLQNKNRQMDITNLILMKIQAVTKPIQMFPPPFLLSKPRRHRPAAVNSTQFHSASNRAGWPFYAVPIAVRTA